MKGKVLINLFLVALVLGLGLWMTTKSGNEGGPLTRLSTLKADDVKVIRVMRDGIPEIVLERAGKRWKQTAPFVARTDGSQAGRLLELLAAQSQQSNRQAAQQGVDDRGIKNGAVAHGDKGFACTKLALDTFCNKRARV